MICPYCNREMRFGRIKSHQLLTWMPDGEHDCGITRWSKSPNSVVIARYFGLTAASAYAHYCESCGKIIIDMEENKNGR